jgi:hypothetical protein
MSFALGMAVVLASGCNESDEAPVEAAKAFASASRSSDIKRMLPLLERDAAARLEAAAEQASDHVGGRRNIEAGEMLQVVEVDRMGSVVRAELLDNDGTTAHVKLTRVDGQDHVLELVLEEGAWRVRLPKPPVGPPADA